jgi:hypothetical protein
MELGWSGFPGRSKVQREAFDEGIPMQLKAWTSCEGQEIMTQYVSRVLPLMWQVAHDHYPVECDRMRDLTMCDVYGLLGTGWNKVTIGVNNPTGLHYDDKNVLVTATLVFGLHGLRGGSHVLMGVDRAAVVIVHECAEGTLILGDYAHALHGNLATIAGDRLIVNAYCSKLVITRIST